MKKAIAFYLFSALQIASMNLLFAGSSNKDTVNTKIDFQKQCFYSAKDEIEAMLSGKKPLDYERAVFITENAYIENILDYELYKLMIDVHTNRIKKIMQSYNDESSQKFKSNFTQTEESKKNSYRKLLANFSIYKYLTDTTYFNTGSTELKHLPYSYSFNDPLGTEDWSNTQVLNLLDIKNKSGNCYALASLYKIFSERLNSDAFISTAPGHVYITHEDIKGIPYNIELAAKAFPGSGSIKAYTNTTHEAVVNGISMRKLDLKESIGLCLVYLAKGYEGKFKMSSDLFPIECAELVLKYDPMNLNAMLLKAQVVEERTINLMNVNKIINISQIEKNSLLEKQFQDYENLIVQLYKLGYRELPIETKNLIIARLRKDDNTPIIITDKTPNPFKHINSPSKDTRYATLSWGIFDEIHEDKPIEQIGKTLLNTKTKKITKFVIEDTLYNHYNFDPVMFAWNVDPLADKAAGWSPYRAFFDNPIKYTDNDGQFEVDPTFAKAYPKVTLILMNADKLYNNQPLPPEVATALRGIDVQKVFNEKFKPALEKYSTLNNEQLQEVVTPGKGPLVSSGFLARVGEDGQTINVNGKTMVEYDDKGNPLNVNEKRENGKVGELKIDKVLAGVLEFTLGGESSVSGLGGKNPSKADLNRAFTSFISTLFHEVVHFGRNQTGVGNKGTDQGKEFEKETFGKDVGRTTPNSLQNNNGTPPTSGACEEE